MTDAEKQIRNLEESLEECRRELRPLEFYKTLAENSQVGLFLHQDGNFLFVNEIMAETVGFAKEELYLKPFLEFVHPDDREMVAERAIARTRGEDPPNRYDLRVVGREGQVIWVRVMAQGIEFRGKPAVIGNLVDMTERKEEEFFLQQDNERLEGQLQVKNMELEARARELTEINSALKKLNNQGREDMEDLEARLVNNIDDLVLPYLRRMRETQLGVDQKVYLAVMEENLSQIMAPFMRKIATRHSNLTPREIEVANLVRMGKTSKQIAKLLEISKRAVEFHRDSLRKKLGLRNSKKNLRAYLASL